MINSVDVARVDEASLRRLLEFALDHDPAGPRLRRTPPKDKAEVVKQLYWLGIIESSRGSGYY